MRREAQTLSKKPQQKKQKRDKRKLFMSIMAGFMVLCMLIPMVRMAITAGM